MEQKGFSLIEVLLVVLIISIITAVCMPGYVRFVQKSRLTKIMLPVLHVMEQNVAVYYLFNKKMPGETELAIITEEENYPGMMISLNSGEITIKVNAPELTDKIHLFDGQEILATPKIKGDLLTGFSLSGDLAVALGFQ